MKQGGRVLVGRPAVSKSRRIDCRQSLDPGVKDRIGIAAPDLERWKEHTTRRPVSARRRKMCRRKTQAGPPPGPAWVLPEENRPRLPPPHRGPTRYALPLSRGGGTSSITRTRLTEALHRREAAVRAADRWKGPGEPGVSPARTVASGLR